jgi:predicted NBD/HSP70 family sugar kinase
VSVRTEPGQPRTAAPSQIRAINKGALLNLIWRERQLSRSDLARHTGLSRSTVSVIVDELLGDDLVQESHVAESRGGRPPIVLRFSDERFFAVGIDMGASHVSAVRTDLRGERRARFTRSHDVQADPRGALDLLVRAVYAVVAGVGPEARCAGIGLAVPCPIDLDDPDALNERILPRWRGHRPGDALRAAFGVEVHMDNDANLGAVAERWWGAGREVDDFAYIKLGTGVGAGLFLNGALYRGARGLAGEIGHVSIDPNGPVCRCGLAGCLEAMIGTGHLLRRLREAEGPDAPSTVEGLVAAARRGEPVANRVVRDAGRYVGLATANLFNLFNPSRVVLGGSLATADDLLLEPLRQTLRERALHTSLADGDVVTSPLGQDDVAIGAATQVVQAALADPDRLTRATPWAGQARTLE